MNNLIDQIVAQPATAEQVELRAFCLMSKTGTRWAAGLHDRLVVEGNPYWDKRQLRRRLNRAITQQNSGCAATEHQLEVWEPKEPGDDWGVIIRCLDDDGQEMCPATEGNLTLQKITKTVETRGSRSVKGLPQVLRELMETCERGFHNGYSDALQGLERKVGNPDVRLESSFAYQEGYLAGWRAGRERIRPLLTEAIRHGAATAEEIVG